MDVVSQVQTSFTRIFGVKTVELKATSCAQTAVGPQAFEIALVLDVSSSMIEENRFKPMQDAVKAFIAEFRENEQLKDRTHISIVPFSSRVSIGQGHTNWLVSYNGAPAVPERWTDPGKVYGSNKELTWLDGVTHGREKGSNSYWFGCIEPRSDVEMDAKGSVSSISLSDATPSAAGFVAMDSNSGSGQSFCPTPIEPLTDNFDHLDRVVDALTSQGSTRLDAGVVAGWYTLSAKWKGLWGDAKTPSDDSSVRKVLVFMTDGQMNTQRGQNKDKSDWRCKNEMNAGCNTTANQDFVSVCNAMKGSGIAVYAVSYSEDADVANLRACASGADTFFSASEKKGAANYITDVYKGIADKLRVSALRLSS